MARIRQYEIDNTITSSDKVLGTDADGNVTKNFELSDLKTYIETGVNILLPVPPGFVPGIDEDGENVRITGVRERLTDLTSNISFYPAGESHDGEFDEVGRGSFAIVADGNNGWILRVTNYTARYYIHSLIGKTVTGNWGVDEDEVSFTVDSINKHERNGDEFDYSITGTDNVIIEYNITPNADQVGALDNAINTFSEMHINTSADQTNTLQLATVYFYTDVRMQDVYIEDLDVDRILIDSHEDDGIQFRQDGNASNWVHLTLNNEGDLVITGEGTGELDINAPVKIIGATNITGATTITGDASLTGDLTIMGETDQVGDIYLTDELVFIDTDFRDGGIRFANKKTGRVVGTDDYSDVRIKATGIEQYDAQNNLLGEITYVKANELQNRVNTPGAAGVAPTLGGVLTQLQIGGTYYTVPSSVSSVAQVLPGLSEELSPKDPDGTGTFQAGHFFYGTDEGIHALWKSNPPSQNQPSGGHITIDDDAVTDEITNVPTITDLTNLFNDIPAGERLFFVESTNNFFDTTPSLNAQVTGNVYEVVSFIASTGVMTFSKLGEGTIVMSAPNIKMTNLSAQSGSFLTIDDTSDVVGTTSLDNVGSLQAKLNFEDTEGDVTGIPGSFEFLGDHAITRSANNRDFTIDVTGRLEWGVSPSPQVANFNTSIFHAYILGHTDVSNPTATLPSSPSKGDIVKFANVSDLFDSQPIQVSTVTIDTAIAANGITFTFRNPNNSNTNVVTVNFASGNTTDQDAAALNTAINADSNVPVTSTVSGSVVTITWDDSGAITGTPLESSEADDITIATVVAGSDADPGDQRTGDYVGSVWRIAPAGSDNIMYKNENLVLNDASTVILVYSGNAALGWIIEQ